MRSTKPGSVFPAVEHLTEIAAGAVLLHHPWHHLGAAAAGHAPNRRICCVASAPVNNGINGDGSHAALARFARSPFNEAILRRWETIAYGSGSSSRLSRRAAAPDQNTAGR